MRFYYTVYRNDRDDRYGGVLIGIKSNLESQLLDIHPTLEICILSVYLSDNKQIIVICAYRSPSTDIMYFNNLCDLITETARKYPNAIIYCAGDFNLPDIDWSNESINSHRYPLLINQRALDMIFPHQK